MKKLWKALLFLVVAGLALFLLIQLVPVNRQNPPVVTQVQWESPQTEALFNRACADCHSNTTIWPWYSYVAPVSWLVAFDVEEGRSKVNLSDLSQLSSRELIKLQEELEEVVVEGEMPPGIYLPMHPSADLTREERQALAAGLLQTLQNSAIIK